MNDDELLADLLVIWGEARDAGQPRSAAELCQDAPHLITRLEAEIHIQEQWERPASPALAQSPAPLHAVPEDLRGQVIGPYKLLELLGEGGMGSVWVAEQHQPIRRTVALKVIKAGMDTKQVLARFEAERQALALMDHPNIAKVLDAGTTDGGRPYFAMELVKGVSVTDYCDKHRLTIRERVELFISVCQAIQHAHQKGIIHRDIKPSNVLVAAYDGKPVAKVIDFGVAKALGQQLTERTLYTGLGGIIGTLQYMSPEQAEFNALDIDTRSDIYSLGVLLYELLTGTTPLTKQQVAEGALTELLKSIRDQEPPKPSTRISESRNTLEQVSAQRKLEPVRLAKYLRGDLDWVVMRSLDKDRNRRYESATSFALDLQRFLNQEPVEARPPSLGYRLSKFTRKHRVLLATLTIFFGVLSLATLFSIWQAVRATQAEQVAKANERQKTEALEAEQRARETAIANEAKALAAKKDADDAREQAEWSAYLANIQAADAEWDRNQVASAFAHLEACPKKLRGWEHDYLFNKFQRGYLTVSNRPTWISSIAISPDGTQIVTGEGRSINLMDIFTGHTTLTLRGHKDFVMSVAFSPDGTRIVSGSHDHTVKLWDAATGQEISTLHGHTSNVMSVAFSPDGTRVASASGDKTLKLWDAATGQELFSLRGHTRNVDSVAFSPDGARIASASGDKTLKLWDAATGQEMFSMRGHASAVRSVACSPDGKRIVSGSDDHTIKLWDAATGQEIFTLHGHSSNVFSVAFSPNGARIVSASGDNTLRLWDAATGQKIASLRGHTGNVNSLTFSLDGNRIVSGSSDHTIKIWNVDWEHEPHVLINTINLVSCIAYSPDGMRIATAGFREPIKLWDAVTGRMLFTIASPQYAPCCVAFNSSGTQIAGAVGTHVKLWNAVTGQEIFTMHGHANNVKCVTFSPDGARIVSAGEDKTLRLWDTVSGQEICTLRGHTKYVDSVAFSPDGERIVSASGDKTLKLWDAASGQEVCTMHGHTDNVNSVAFSPDGERIVSASGDKTLRIWDATSGLNICTMHGHTDSVHGVAFSPDGSRVVSGSNKTVMLWDAATGQVTMTLHDNVNAVYCVAFSPDGTRILSGGSAVLCWDRTCRPFKIK